MVVENRKHYEHSKQCLPPSPSHVHISPLHNQWRIWSDKEHKRNFSEEQQFGGQQHGKKQHSPFGEQKPDPFGGQQHGEKQNGPFGGHSG